MRLRVALATSLAVGALVGPAAVATTGTAARTSTAVGGLRAEPGWTLSRLAHETVVHPSAGAGADIVELPTGRVDEKRFARVVVRGTPGTMLRLASGASVSAPIRLDSVWQSAGLSVPAGATSIRLVRVGLAPATPVEVRSATTTNSPRSTTGVRKGTRMITLDGRPFVIRGYTYMPYSIGTNPDQPPLEPAACQRDARLMAPAGVDLVRISWEDQASIAEVQDYLQCADAFYANHIGIVWIVGPPAQGQYAIDQPATPVSAPDAFIEATWVAVDNAIRVVGDHPATYMWQVGNEVERWNSGAGRPIWLGDRSTGKVGALDEIARRVHAANPGHLVGTSIAEGYQSWIGNSVVPSLDFWALTLFNNTRYPSPQHMNGLHRRDHRPMFAVEMGADRYHCARGNGWVSDQPSVSVTCAQVSNGGSYEDERAQAEFDDAAWHTVMHYLATPQNPQGTLAGGLMFTFNDIWWFTLSNLTPSPAVTHEVYGGTGYPVEPDGDFNPEWTGVAMALLPHATAIRPTTLAFDEMARLWTGRELPGIVGLTTGAELAPASCTLVARWRTTVPTSADVQAGLEQVVAAAGEVAQDNTTYTMSQDDAGFARQHDVRLTAPLAVGTYRVIVRSFTADGRSVTTQPQRVSCG